MSLTNKTFINIKNGGFYKVLCEARDSNNYTFSGDNYKSMEQLEMVVYYHQNNKDQIFTRNKIEFLQKFTEVSDKVEKLNSSDD